MNPYSRLSMDTRSGPVALQTNDLLRKLPRIKKDPIVERERVKKFVRAMIRAALAAKELEPSDARRLLLELAEE